jgi:uncharacterized membrane protein YGL010W
MTKAKVSRSSLPTSRLEKYFKDYSLYHKTRGNKITHYFGIPFIMVGLLGLLGELPVLDGLTGSLFLRVDGGTILLFFGILWYFFLDWKISIPFAFVVTGFYFLGRSLPTFVNLILFISGWILQGVGHAVFEKKSPAFLKNVAHVMIGPIWIFARLIGYE